MSNVFTRFLKRPRDYMGVCRSVNLTLKEHRDEGGGVHTFIFTPDKPLSWKAGQHAIFTMPDRQIEGKKWRPFSVASAPHEGVIQISTNISDDPSSFKQNLLDLKVGDKIKMNGPYGEFYIKPQMKHVVGIVGGVGITPFRSVINDAVINNIQIPLTLIYSARDKHLYQEELQNWAEQNPNINIIYTHTPDEVNAELSRVMDDCKDHAHFFISGAPRMIEALQETCINEKIAKDHIVSDPFKGY